MTRTEYEQALWTLSLEQARFDRDRARFQAAAAKAEQARSELMTESVRNALAEDAKAKELPQITVRTPTQEEIDN